MKKLLVLLVVVGLLVVFASQAQANVIEKVKENWSNWETHDKVLFGTFMVFECADWAQTRFIAANPETCSEMNPYLGPHPTLEEVDRYFATCIGLNYVITRMLPDKIRNGYYVVIIVGEAGVVKHNTELKVGFKF